MYRSRNCLESREYWYWRHLSFSFWKMVWDAFLVQDVSRWSPVPGRSMMMLARVTILFRVPYLSLRHLWSGPVPLVASPSRGFALCLIGCEVTMAFWWAEQLGEQGFSRCVTWWVAIMMLSCIQYLQYLLVSENIELLEFTSGSWALRLAVARKGSLLCVPPGDCGAATEKKDVTGGAGVGLWLLRIRDIRVCRPEIGPFISSANPLLVVWLAMTIKAYKG